MPPETFVLLLQVSRWGCSLPILLTHPLPFPEVTRWEFYIRYQAAAKREGIRRRHSFQHDFEMLSEDFREAAGRPRPGGAEGGVKPPGVSRACGRLGVFLPHPGEGCGRLPPLAAGVPCTPESCPMLPKGEGWRGSRGTRRAWRGEKSNAGARGGPGAAL